MADSLVLESFIDLLCGSADSELRLPVLSSSMAPLLVTSDEIVLSPCSWRQCRPGELVVFRQGASLTVHRYMYLTMVSGRLKVFQKGDSLERGGFIEPDCIIGRCIVRIRDGIETPLNEKKETSKHLRIQRFRLFFVAGKDVIKWMLKKVIAFIWPWGQ